MKKQSGWPPSRSKSLGYGGIPGVSFNREAAMLQDFTEAYRLKSTRKHRLTK